MLLHPPPRLGLVVAAGLSGLLGLAGGAGCTRSNPAYWGLPDSGIVVIEGIVSPDAALPDRAPDGVPAHQPDTATAPEASDASPDQTAVGSADASANSGVVSPGIALTGADLTRQYGGAGGVESQEQCPGDEVLIGYRGTVDLRPTREGVIGNLEATCGRLAPSGGPGSRMRVYPEATLPRLGSVGGFLWTARCPTDEVIVAFGGYADNALEAVQFHCASLFTTAQETVSIGNIRVLPVNGRIGQTAFQDRCNPGQVARGHKVRAGQWIDSFGLVCGTPTLVR